MKTPLSKNSSQPIETLINGSRQWMLNGKIHRADGPAIEKDDGLKAWLLNNMLHRVDGPAIEMVDGTKQWYSNGKRHRVDGPAIEHADGAKEWWLDDKLHRVDGPAIEETSGKRVWYLFGEELAEGEHPHSIKKEILKAMEKQRSTSKSDAGEIIGEAAKTKIRSI